MKKPKQITDIDVDKLKSACEFYINELQSYSFNADEDCREFIFEAAMETFYGKEVWNYINVQT